MRVRITDLFEQDFDKETLLIKFDSIDDARDVKKLNDYLECHKYHSGSIMQLFEDFKMIKEFVDVKNSTVAYFKTNIVIEKLKQLIKDGKYSIVQNDKIYILRSNIDDKVFYKECYDEYMNTMPDDLDVMNKQVVKGKIKWYKWKEKKFNINYTECIKLYKQYY